MSHIEYELRVLEIDVTNLIKKIKALGGTLTGSYEFRRYVFETVPAVKGRWVRLRTDGHSTTLTVKQIDADTVDGTSEWETTVDDFDITLKMLQKMGLRAKGYQENKRTEYSLHGVTLALDTWPLIPSYLELEGRDGASISSVARKLGFMPSDLIADSPQKIYKKYGIDIQAEPNLRFEDEYCA